MTRGTERGGGGGTGLIVRRLFLAGVVVLVGRWGLKKRQNGARQKLGSCLEK